MAFKEFSALVRTPGNLTTGIKLPGPAVVYASIASTLASQTAVASVGGKNFSLPAKPANIVSRLGYFEEGETITVVGGLPSVVTIFIDNGLGKKLKIGGS